MKLCENEAFYYVDQNVDGKVFRVFTYRLASYTEFCLPNALECRGHTFLMDGDTAVDLVCLPPAKFFNLYENNFTMDLDLKNAVLYMDKLDGSLISTVKDSTMHHGFRLKSKTSFISQQAVDAYQFLLSNHHLLMVVSEYIDDGYTVNFEWIGSSNQIVVRYPEHSLKVLSARNLLNGHTEYPDISLQHQLSSKYVVSCDYTMRSYEEILDMTGVEGFVVLFNDGRLAKIKNNWYSKIHRCKDSVNNPKALFQACLYETSDDLRSLFHDDELAMKQITAMETLVRTNFNHISSQLQKFYDENKLLSRKDYAILAQQTFKDGTFPLAMNLYLGKDMGLKDWMMKNYREFGITDVQLESEN